MEDYYRSEMHAVHQKQQARDSHNAVLEHEMKEALVYNF